jgi:hypothetical protein
MTSQERTRNTLLCRTETPLLQGCEASRHIAVRPEDIVTQERARTLSAEQQRLYVEVVRP